jgi:hypothetical protein
MAVRLGVESRLDVVRAITLGALTVDWTSFLRATGFAMNASQKRLITITIQNSLMIGKLQPNEEFRASAAGCLGCILMPGNVHSNAGAGSVAGLMIQQ